MFNVDELKIKLKENNFKSTPQRFVIYNKLAATKSHPTVEQLTNMVHETHPHIGIATVYKTLFVFKEIGAVREINVGEDKFRYDADIKSHTHFVCNYCNEVFDFDDIKYTFEDKDFKVESHDFYLYGKCKDCK